MKVKEEYTLNVSQADAAELKFNYSDVISAFESIYPESYESILTVPRQRFKHNDFHHSYCFAINSRVESDLTPIMVCKEKSDDPSGIVDKYIFDPQMNDVFELDVPPGIFFAVHSPYDAVNPFERGYFLSPGKHYIIDVFIREDKKLSYPYDTDCTDYEEQWLENRFTGVRSKQMCRQKCHVDYFAECYNCSRIDFEYPSQEKICSSEGG
ncbi:uncharacterized protein [Parasteatoda tepidariorum]|uniref:uncharacterized protein n=1 Tax=Parasteatoda tepidariorum TaxID=114398 RepID=UPI0039BD6252